MSWKLVSEGKVRKVYENSTGSRVLLVASDGVSAFDQKLGVNIPGKGEMLTTISKHWFEKTMNLVPNAYCAVRAEFGVLAPEDVVTIGADLDTVTPMMKLDMLPIEAIVRGYITGSAWSAYEKGERQICGERLPEGLRNSARLAYPIFTPTTKAPAGEHDENLDFDQLVGHLAHHGVHNPYSRAEKVRELSLKLYNFASAELLSKGIILADTKFEFGINPSTGSILLADELFTPDSSRFWSAAEYRPGRVQKSLDKQIIRDWVKAHPGEVVSDEVLRDAAGVYKRITDIMLSI